MSGNILLAETNDIILGSIFRPNGNEGNLIGNAPLVYVPGYVLKQSSGAKTSQVAVADAAPNNYVAATFTADSDYTLRRIVLALRGLAGGGAHVWTVEIRNHDGSNPGAVLANGSSSITGIADGVISSLYNIDFNPGCILVNTTLYCIVLHRGGLNAVDHIRIHYGGFGGPSPHAMQIDADDAGVWTNVDATSNVKLETWAIE